MLPDLADPAAVVAGPTVTNATVVGTNIVIHVANGVGMYWNGTKQCTRCCGLRPPAGAKGAPAVPYGGRGLTNAYAMTVLKSTGAWQHIDARCVPMIAEAASQSNRLARQHSLFGVGSNGGFCGRTRSTERERERRIRRNDAHSSL